MVVVRGLGAEPAMILTNVEAERGPSADGASGCRIFNATRLRTG